MSALLSGNISSRRLASAAPLVRATETVTPSAIRATVRTLKHPRPHWDTSNCIGIHTSTRGTNGASKPSGMTPMTVYGSSSSVIDRPNAPTAPPKRCCQSALLSRTTRSPPGTSSSGKNPRPSDGCTPRTVLNIPSVTVAPLSTIGSPSPISVGAKSLHAPIPAKSPGSAR